MALSLMPIDEVHSQFQRLQNIVSISLKDLLLYFKNQWVHGVVPIHMWNLHSVDHRTNNTSEGNQTIFFHLFHFKGLSFTIRILAYNLRFSTRLSKKHPNIWSFIQLIQSEHVRYEHISIQLDAGASAPKQSAKTKAFQARFDTLRTRFLRNKISAQELLSGLSMLIGKKMSCYCIVNFLGHFF